MKKILLICTFMMFFCMNVNATEQVTSTIKRPISIVNCESINSLWIKENGSKKIVRLLAFDMADGSLNEEINNYACMQLKTAKTLEIETDPLANDLDKYNRELVWIYVDGKLLQKDLIEHGYGQVNYVLDEYLYLEELCIAQKQAVVSKKGIWNYPSIEEKYCQSGFTAKDIHVKKDDTKKIKKYDIKLLWFLVFINSGILLLVLPLTKKVRINEKR